MRATAARERPACPPPPPGHALRWAQGQLAELEREMYVGGRMPPEAYIHAAAPALAAPAAAPASRTAALVTSAAKMAAVVAAAAVPAAYASGALRRVSSAHLHDWLGGEVWWRAAALRAFAKLDREACGTLGAAEVVAYSRSNANRLFLGAQQPLLADGGLPLARGVQRALVADVDMDGDGRIDLNEFAGMLWRVRRRRRGLLRCAFLLSLWAASHHRGAPHAARTNRDGFALCPRSTPRPAPHGTPSPLHAECTRACGSAQAPPVGRVARRDDAAHATGRGEATPPLVAPCHPPVRRPRRAPRRRAPRRTAARGRPRWGGARAAVGGRGGRGMAECGLRTERRRRLGHSRPAGVAHPRGDARPVPRHGRPLRR